MDNETYQQTIEIFSKEKRDKYNHQYFGDKTSKTTYRLSRRYLKEPIIDIGAGSGALVRTLQQRGHTKSNGIDLYPKEDFIKQGSITDIPEQDVTYNTVYCSEVIEHLTSEQIDKGFNEIRRIMKPNGTLILTVPFDENLELSSSVCPHCGHRFHKVGHLQSFNKKRISELLKKNNFTVISMKVYALGAMSKLPLGRYFNWLFCRMNYESISKTLFIVAKSKNSLEISE